DGAIPHIGEALFRPQVTEQLGNYNAAFEKACQPGGKQFLVDMFSQECFAAPQFPDEPEMGC
ncbi:hypothetical protein LJC34_07545, partial [Oscillospiraceae bacterium OttesenSCG-928-G22]|nr:hypothetical protein [Oscillospiraceae bacterium OttesenSCG-928-G22]